MSTARFIPPRPTPAKPAGEPEYLHGGIQAAGASADEVMELVGRLMAPPVGSRVKGEVDAEVGWLLYHGWSLADIERRISGSG